MTIRVRLANYDFLVCSLSGGKDSSCTPRHIVLRCQMEQIPLGRVVAVHADLGRFEWAGAKELAEQHARHYGVRFEVVKREKGDLLDAVRPRRKYLDAHGKPEAPAWPDSVTRYCTSYFK